MPSGVDAPVAALALHSNGNLVVAYGGTSGGASGIWLTQLLPGGAPDPTFGFAGSTFTPLATAPTVRAMTIQPDDTILVIAAPNLLLRFGADVAIAVEVPALESWFLPLLATLVAAGAWKFGRRA